MNARFLVLALLSAASGVAAQGVGGTSIRDRARQEAANTRTVDSTTNDWEVGGLRVIHRRGAANEIVVANLYLLGGSRQVTAATAGIEPLVIAASERGTATYSRDQLRAMLAKVDR